MLASDKKIEKGVNAGNSINVGLDAVAANKKLSKEPRLSIRSKVLTPTLWYGSGAWNSQKKDKCSRNEILCAIKPCTTLYYYNYENNARLM